MIRHIRHYFSHFPSPSLTLSLSLPLLLLFLAACQADTPPVLPTQANAAVVPTATVTPVPSATANVPPTRDLSTATPVPPTPVTIVPSATPTPVNDIINLTSPAADVQLVLGGSVTASGLVGLNPGYTISLVLVSANGRVLFDEPVSVNDNRSWQATVDVPNFVSGPGQLQAVVRDPEGIVVAQDLIPVTLAIDTSSNDRFLAMSRPVPDTNVAGGFYLFFDGVAQRPVGGQIIMQILVDGCTATATSQSFAMNGSGYWQGYLYIPNNISGPACAIAYFGTPGSADWREAQAPITIAPGNDEASVGVVISQPATGVSVTAGATITVYGVAYNAVEGQVQVTLQLESGVILTQVIAITDDFGYWETPLTIPLDVGLDPNAGDEDEEISAVGLLSATIGDPDGDTFAQTQNVINILPAPTPTPLP